MINKVNQFSDVCRVIKEHLSASTYGLMFERAAGSETQSFCTAVPTALNTDDLPAELIIRPPLRVRVGNRS
jgi:hypothetical protein